MPNVFPLTMFTRKTLVIFVKASSMISIYLLGYTQRKLRPISAEVADMHSNQHLLTQQTVIVEVDVHQIFSWRAPGSNQLQALWVFWLLQVSAVIIQYLAIYQSMIFSTDWRTECFLSYISSILENRIFSLIHLTELKGQLDEKLLVFFKYKKKKWLIESHRTIIPKI